MSDVSKLLNSLGLCARAGGVIFGVPMVCEALRKGGSKTPIIVLESSDTSENTHKRITDKCNFYKTRHVRIDCTGDELASALGKSANLSRLVEKYLNI